MNCCVDGWLRAPEGLERARKSQGCRSISPSRGGLGGSKYIAPETRQFNGDSRPQADCDQQRELAYPMKSERVTEATARRGPKLALRALSYVRQAPDS